MCNTLRAPSLVLSYDNDVPIDLFHEGVTIIFRVTRDDSWLAKAITNTYSRLTLGFLVSIVREFLTCQ